MRILIVHNTYKQPGGEDVAVEQEVAILKRGGHEVIEYRRSNHEIDSIGIISKVSVPMSVVWSRQTYWQLRKLIQREKPDVAHFHNTFALISPSGYYACKSLGVPVVQTLHNYRLLCARADFFRKQQVCEECLGKTPPWPAILYGCYHDLRSHSVGVVAMLTFHRWKQTWNKSVDAFIALTQFGKSKFVQGGLPAEKIHIKPNFVTPDPGPSSERGEFAIFAGRFSPEKRLETLLTAWNRLDGIPLRLLGGGPEVPAIKNLINSMSLNSVQLLGQIPRADLFGMLKQARFLVFPSEWYEGFPMTIVEAFANGIPVIASRLGAMQEIVQDGRTGLLFTPGDSEDLASKVDWAWNHEKEMQSMGHEARKEFEEKYSAERNYSMLMHIYRSAIEKSQQNN